MLGSESAISSDVNLQDMKNDCLKGKQEREETQNDEEHEFCLDNVDISETSVQFLVSKINGEVRGDVVGVSSIGCGLAKLESKLTKHFREVQAVDQLEFAELSTSARQSLTTSCHYYTQVYWEGSGCNAGLSTANIPYNHVLMFVFASLSEIDFRKYVTAYKGSCIIIISDPNSCIPTFNTIITGFLRGDYVEFPSILDAFISVFKRV
jgi:hypothetical protein